MTNPTTETVRAIAEDAITKRLRSWDPGAILSITEDDEAVVLALSSGGNAIACETAVRQHGWRCTPVASEHGVALRIEADGAPPAADETV